MRTPKSRIRVKEAKPGEKRKPNEEPEPTSPSVAPAHTRSAPNRLRSINFLPPSSPSDRRASPAPKRDTDMPTTPREPRTNPKAETGDRLATSQRIHMHASPPRSPSQRVAIAR